MGPMLWPRRGPTHPRRARHRHRALRRRRVTSSRDPFCSFSPYGARSDAMASFKRSSSCVTGQGKSILCQASILILADIANGPCAHRTASVSGGSTSSHRKHVKPVRPEGVRTAIIRLLHRGHRRASIISNFPNACAGVFQRPAIPRIRSSSSFVHSTRRQPLD